jgi:hypothetical protein
MAQSPNRLPSSIGNLPSSLGSFPRVSAPMGMPRSTDQMGSVRTNIISANPQPMISSSPPSASPTPGGLNRPDIVSYSNSARSPVEIPRSFGSAPQTTPYERLISDINQMSVESEDNAFEYPNRMNLGWKDHTSLRKFYQIGTALNRTPDTLDPTPGGKAAWRNPAGKTGGHFESLEVWDHHYPHLKPNFYSPHMKVTVLMPLKEHTQKKLCKMTSCIVYHPNVGLVTVDSYFLGGAIMELALLKMVDEGRINHWEAMKYCLMWKPIIGNEWRDAAQQENIYQAETPFTDALERYVLSR